MTPASILAAIGQAQQLEALLLATGAPLLELTPKQVAAANLASLALGMVAKSIQQKTDIEDDSFAQLDAQEALILAADARAEAAAEIKDRGG